MTSEPMWAMRCTPSSMPWEGPLHRRTEPALSGIVQTGAQPISWVSLACELQRDWARLETVPDIVDIVLNSRLLAGV